ncbi:MAG: hypothetical protein HC821_04095 [Lewinella sp.]|nr:hypothetical protein [Lewinella sp.]
MLLLFICLQPAASMAQPVVCLEEEAVYAVDCRYTCISCNLDGIDRLHITPLDLRQIFNSCSTGPGEVIGFVALSTYLKLEISIGNCTNTDILGRVFVEVAAFEHTDGTCFDLSLNPYGTPIFDCPLSSGVGRSRRILNNSTNVFESRIPLTIGQVYFLELALTGSGGVQTCEYSIRVLEGNTQIPDVAVPAMAEEPAPCLGETVTHQLLNPEPLTTYTFTLNGNTVSVGPPSVSLRYAVAGNYELCVQADNVCSPPKTVCYSFNIRDAEPVLVNLDLCPGECIVLGREDTACRAGEYAVRLTDQNGCDSLVIYTLTAREANETRVSASICSGDSIWFINRYYSEAGSYAIPLRNRFGCDSTILFLVTQASICPVLGTIVGEAPAVFPASKWAY